MTREESQMRRETVVEEINHLSESGGDITALKAEADALNATINGK